MTSGSATPTDACSPAGSGFVIADVDARRTEPADAVPDRFWLHRRGAIAAATWTTQRVAGRRWYARHVRFRVAP